MVGLVGAYVWAMILTEPGDDPDTTARAFGRQALAAVSLGAVGIVLFGVTLINDYPFLQVRERFNQLQLEAVVLLLAAATVAGASADRSVQGESHPLSLAGRLRSLVDVSKPRLAGIARTLLILWLGLGVYQWTIQALSALLGAERMFGATLAAALLAGGFGFASSYALQQLSSVRQRRAAQR
jgi:hypothetical protein